MKRSFFGWRQLALLAPLFALFLVACGSPGQVSQTPPTAVVSTAESGGAAAEARYLDDLAARNALTGSVLLARGGEVLLSRGYGLADEASQAPNTPQTRFRIGSNTKQFTAMAILLLQERGKLRVQDHL